MRRGRQPVFVTGIVSGVLAGCTAPARPDAPVLDCVMTRSAAPSGTCAGITLRLVPLDSQFVRGRPFRIAYVIQNTGAPRKLQLQSMHIVLRMLDSAGKELDAQPIPNVAPTDDASLVLPTGGFVGRVFDLRCPTIEFAMLERCREWPVPHTGTIRVVFSLGATSYDETTKDFYTSLDLADTIRLTVVETR